MWITLWIACTDTTSSMGGLAASPKLLLAGDLSAGDLVLSEVMADPAAVTDTYGEWFEIYNASGDDVDLKGIMVEDSDSTEGTLGTFTLAPDSYAVIARNNSTSLNGGVTADLRMSSMRLANTADSIVLTHGGLVIDEISWTSAVSGAAWNLDSATLDAASNDDEFNWCDANTTYGSGDYGTPGDANRSCAGDVDEDLDTYTVGEGDCDDEDASVHPGARDVVGDGIDQNCSAIGIEDVEVGDLVITELHVNPQVVIDAYGEWVEITNVADVEIDLDGLWAANPSLLSWRDFEISRRLTIEPGQHIVIARNSNPLINGGVTPDASDSQLRLANTADTLALYSGTTIIDQVSWTGTVIGEGEAYSLDPDSIDAVANDTASNWCSAVAVFGDGDAGSPGELNLPCGVDQVTMTDLGLVLEAPDTGTYSGGINAPTVEWDPFTSTWIMVFEYEPAGVTPPGDCSDLAYLGRATSSDALTWTLDASPLLEPDTDDPDSRCGYVHPSLSLSADGTFELFFGVRSDASGRTKAVGIGHATSSDGASFAVVDTNLVSASALGHPTVISTDSTTHMLYVQTPDIYALSRDDSDGTWTSPVVSISPSEVPFAWDEERVTVPAAFCASTFGPDTLGIVFAGRDRMGTQSWAYATSTDGVDWDTAPLVVHGLDADDAYHWDTSRVSVESFPGELELLMWYSVDAPDGRKAIGVLTTTTSWDEGLVRGCW